MPEDLPPEFNDILRSGVVGLIAKINIEGLPVGGVLSFIIGLLWPESDTSEKTWNSIKKYAESMMKQALDRERTDRLSKRLEGLRSVARLYRDTSLSSKQKGQYLTSLMSNLALFEPDYWDDRTPEQMFPLFASFGTLWIFALAEQAFFYKEVYHEDDPDAGKHRETLDRNITKYTKAAQAMFDNLYSWRFSLLQIKESQARYATQSESTWTFVDNYDNFTETHRSGDWGHSWHNPAGQRVVEAVAADRVSQINAGFVENLQSMLSIAELWEYVNPRIPRPLKVYTIANEGPWGGMDGAPFMHKPPGAQSRISRIRVRHGSVVDCLEIFYDGQSAGIHGNPKGGALAELELEHDEYVVEVSGRSGIFFDQIYFITNKQRRVGGGGSAGGAPFVAKGHGSWEGISLFAVGGRSDERRLTALKLQWKHLTAMPTYVPTYKREGKALSSSTNLQLKAKDGDFVSNFVEEYSGYAARWLYWPKHGAVPITLQFHLADKDGISPAAALSNNDVVQIWTSEPKAKDHPYLGKYTSDFVYYYAKTPGERRQLWELIKMIPSDGPILFGEKVYLRNVEECNYLFPADDNYLGSRSEPYAWECVR